MRAAIDLGSNSVLLTVVDDSGAVLHDEARVVGLGKGLGDGGAFAADRMEDALAALADYARVAASLGVAPADVRAVATSAARRATNSGVYFARVERETGLRIEVISGDEEARLTWAGALSSLDLPAGDVMVVDLGGGSTELAVGRDALRWRHSFEVGSVRLTEQVLGPDVPPATPAHLAAMRAHVDGVFAAPAVPAGVRCVVGVAGSVTTLVATELGLAEYDGARVHGSTLTDAALAGFERRLIGLDAAGRRALFAVSPKRADFLLAGTVILRAALAKAGADAMRVSDRGLRYGVLASSAR
ncbi:MAG: Ppx/GppA family phosphatase [Alphaproteobacteria bacterium]|nr:Ppx/GppA family phosphatase [Alphaproteobacteria bacterium]